jgi:CheY-like chemotaxis protein
MLKMLNRIIGEDVTIKIDLQHDIWNIVADSSRIDQIIMNLSVNARDAMAKHGSILIKSENIIIDEETQKNIYDSYPGKFVRLTIEDTGKGMSKDTIAHIFEPFFTTKEFGKGTGLGLSVVYGIVKEHKGWINVYSELDKGTTIRIYLPANSEGIKEEVKEIKELTDLKGNGKRILLIEDEESIIRFAKRILGSNGYIVFAAKNGKEAIKLFNEEDQAFDMIFSDSILPDTTGLELVEKITSMKPEIKVLLTSGYLDDKSQWSVIKEKNYTFLQKPYEMNNLLKIVKKVIESQ